MLTDNPAHIAEITNRLHDHIHRLPPPSSYLTENQLFVQVLTDVLGECMFDVNLEIYEALIRYQPLSIFTAFQPEDSFWDL